MTGTADDRKDRTDHAAAKNELPGNLAGLRIRRPGSPDVRWRADANPVCLDALVRGIVCNTRN